MTDLEIQSILVNVHLYFNRKIMIFRCRIKSVPSSKLVFEGILNQNYVEKSQIINFQTKCQCFFSGEKLTPLFIETESRVKQQQQLLLNRRDENLTTYCEFLHGNVTNLAS